jgi:hypothetical protein
MLARSGKETKAADPAPHWPEAQEDGFEWGEADERILLPLEGLIPDSEGNVVLLTDAGPAAVGVLTGEMVRDSGTAGAQVTAAGLDVSGYQYVTFESGLTLYYPDGMDILVRADGA